MSNNEYFCCQRYKKKQIKTAQGRVLLSANSELFILYWNIGCVINEHSVWSNKFIENLARDIKLDFPDTRGVFCPQFEIYGEIRKDFSRERNCVVANCTINLDAQQRAFGQSKRPRHNFMV